MVVEECAGCSVCSIVCTKICRGHMKGTTFHVFLPKLDIDTAEKIEQREPIPTGHERILFVDDEAAIINAGKQMLERLGYEVVTRTGSIDALELFRSQPDQFDLILTDMTMPNMTGVELSQEIMNIRPDIPVISPGSHRHRHHHYLP